MTNDPLTDSHDWMQSRCGVAEAKSSIRLSWLSITQPRRVGEIAKLSGWVRSKVDRTTGSSTSTLVGMI